MDHEKVNHHEKQSNHIHNDDSGQIAARVMLEWGLAEHHFERKGKVKGSFEKAKDYSGVEITVTGAKGKRTKFQTEDKTQYLVQAFSASYLRLLHGTVTYVFLKCKISIVNLLI